LTLPTDENVVCICQKKKLECLAVFKKKKKGKKQMKATNLKLMAYKSYIYEMNRETKLWLIKAVPTKK
jgi:hypothetical protein